MDLFDVAWKINLSLHFRHVGKLFEMDGLGGFRGYFLSSLAESFLSHVIFQCAKPACAGYVVLKLGKSKKKHFVLSTSWDLTIQGLMRARLRPHLAQMHCRYSGQG